MAQDLVEIVHAIRTKLPFESSLLTLEAAFKVNDPGNMKFQFTEFEAVLSKVGIFLSRQATTKLYRHFDKEDNEQVDGMEVVTALIGQLSAARQAMVQQAWAGRGGGPSVPFSAIEAAYDAAAHPDVLTGTKTADQVKAHSAVMALASFESVTYEQFLHAMAAASAKNPYDDDFALFTGPFGLAQQPSSVSGAQLDQVETVLMEKVRQRTSPTSQESQTLRLGLKTLDLKGSTMLDFPTFKSGLESFGVVLEDSISKALFDRYARDGTVSIDEFSKKVCAQ
jgi:Ca2+-binding EF-hand superfamily protein